MKDNSGHSEGGEVPKLTKEQFEPLLNSLRIKFDNAKDLADKHKSQEVAAHHIGLMIAYSHAIEGIEKVLKSTGSVAAPKPDTTEKKVVGFCNFCSTAFPGDYNHTCEEKEAYDNKLLAAAKESIKNMIRLAEKYRDTASPILKADIEVISRAKALLEH